ncbi:TetR family transcriptional regulator [Jatrophihabitans sp. YIM 134969]
MTGAESGDSSSTRERIVASAMALFTENGYDRTTMRAIAADAGLSVGNAYYYFASKEHLIQGFYDLVNSEHRARAHVVIEGTTDFSERLTGVLDAWVDVAMPHHAFAAQFFRHAADPNSPMSPFSAESAPTRSSSVASMAAVIDGSDIKADPDLLSRLPSLLWLYQMGIVLFWVYDSSEGAERTRLLIHRSVPLVERLLRLSRYRLLQPVTRQTLQLLDDLGWRDFG